jgi:hypothetical protein
MCVVDQTDWLESSYLPHSRCHDDDAAVTLTTASIIASKHPVQEPFASNLLSTSKYTHDAIKLNENY